MESEMTKKVIGGKRYDTETAELVASYDNGLGCPDFRNVHEQLYRTKRGNWFICGSGGPLSAYSQPAYGGGYCGGSNIIRPLSPNEALEWLERHGKTATIENHFKANIEDA
jgi:hypothetical protein